VPWKTWHERQVERPSRRELVKDLGSVLLNGFLFIVMLGVTAAIVLVLLGFFLGLYNDWLIGILSTRVLLPFAIILLPALIVAWAAGMWLYRKAPKCDAPAPPGNPIAILPALGFVAFVAFAAVAAKWAAGRFGEQGIALLLLSDESADCII